MASEISFNEGERIDKDQQNSKMWNVTFAINEAILPAIAVKRQTLLGNHVDHQENQDLVLAEQHDMVDLTLITDRIDQPIQKLDNKNILEGHQTSLVMSAENLATTQRTVAPNGHNNNCNIINHPVKYTI